MSVEKNCVIAFKLVSFNATEPADESGSMTLVVGEDAFAVSLAEVTVTKGLQSILDYLYESERMTLVYTENNGIRSYSQIGSLAPDREKGEFMRLYTSVTTNQMSGNSAKTYTYNNVTLVESNTGVTGLSIQKDCVIALLLDVLK